MKKLIAVVSMAFALSGCGASLTGNYHEVDCTAEYEIMTFPSQGVYKVQVDAIRENRFGQKSYRLSIKNRQVKFLNRWQPAKYFENLECK